MRRAVYPGSFNPWHAGHTDILKKTLQLFDEVVIAQGFNPDKSTRPPICGRLWEESLRNQLKSEISPSDICAVHITTFTGFLPVFVKEQEACAVIRGLRNGYDLQHEMNQQYWYEDLGLKVPVVCLITDRRLAHISSSAIRAQKRVSDALSARY